jgi:hypothetical protein
MTRKHAASGRVAACRDCRATGVDRQRDGRCAACGGLGYIKQNWTAKRKGIKKDLMELWLSSLD